jgi:S-layer protein
MSTFTSIQTQVEALYVGYFMRAGDPSGTQYWENQLQGGVLTLAGEAASFSVQLEAQADYPFLATGALGAPETELGVATYTNVYNFINQVYQDLFNRSVDPSGLAYWSGQLVANVGNPQATGGFIINVISGAATGGTDDQNLQAKVQVATFITNNAFSSGLTWNSEIQAESVALIGATTNASSGAGSVATEEAAWTSFLASLPITLTTGPDNIVVTYSKMIVGTGNGAGATFTPGDSINGNGQTGLTLVVSDLSTGATWTPTSLAGVTVIGIQTAIFNSGEAVTANPASSAQGWSGLTQLTINDAGATIVTAAATTSVTVVDAGIAGAVTTTGGNNINITNFGASATVGGATGNPAGTITITDTAIAAHTISTDGGTNTSVTITGAAAASPATGQILIGANVAPIGTVTVAATTGTANGDGVGLINVNGGTTVTVTEMAGNSGATGNNTFEGDVLVNGNATTTTVTVNQSPTAVGASAVMAVAGIVGVPGVAGSPGVQGVTAVTALAPVAAKAAIVGTTAGSVLIQDANYNTGAANTITTVTLNNYSGSVIDDNALSNLTLEGVAAGLVITNATSSGGSPTANSTLTLTLNTLSGAGDAVVDANNEIKTLNVLTAGGNSTMAAFIDSGLTTLNISGTAILALPVINGSLTTLAVSGGGGFSDNAATATGGLAVFGSALTITDTSSGKFSAALNDTQQTFVGSTGQDVIIISSTADATKTITAGSATNNELILEGGAFALTSATAAKVTGFEILGVAANVSGTIDMSVLDPTASTLDILGNSTITFNKVATGASISLENTNTTSVSVTYVDANGVNDTTSITIGTATNSAARTEASILLQDANLVGVGRINVVSNDTTFADANVITTLTDNGLANLNVSGNAGLAIGLLSETTTQATSFTLDNTETGAAGVTIATFTDANLGNLIFAGTNASAIATLNDAGAVLSVSNTGTMVANVGTIADGFLTSLTLGANVALGQANFLNPGIGLQDNTAVGVTVLGAADNAHVTIHLSTGAGPGNIDAINLGNGNDYIIDASTATTGTVNISVGTGSNLIALGTPTTATDAVFNITLGAHSAATGMDVILFNDTAGVNYTTVVNNTVTGMVVGDIIVFGSDAASAATVTSVAAGGTLAATITAIGTALSAAHTVASAVFGGNTFVGETLTGTVGAADTTLIEIVGTHTFTAAAGQLTIAS